MIWMLYVAGHEALGYIGANGHLACEMARAAIENMGGHAACALNVVI